LQYSQNFLIVLRFLGTNYHGWQIQKNALTIQEVFQNALYKITKEKNEIKGCSRTDSGVHANAYCISTKNNMNINPDNLVLALNKFLPNDIRVIKCMKVNSEFHARYSCLAKEYVYKIYNHKIMDPFFFNRSLHFWYHLDLNLMKNLSSIFIGKHDFSSFCSFDKRKKDNMCRNIMEFDINKSGNIVEFRIKADGFLYNMVRIIVGTLLEANHRKMSKKDIIYILESKNRKLSGPTLPACGLYLNKIFYEGLII